jgi:hypothetical protein
MPCVWRLPENLIVLLSSLYLPEQLQLKMYLPAIVCLICLAVIWENVIEKWAFAGIIFRKISPPPLAVQPSGQGWETKKSVENYHQAYIL